MKLAVLGDIHGNMEALRAAHEAAASENPDRIIHLGDLGGYAPFVNEVVDFLMEHGIDGVQGNYDYNVARGSAHCGCRYEDPAQAALADLSFGWTKEHVTDKSRKYMKSLPRDMTIESDGKMLSIFHATPHKNNIYWTEDRPDKFFLEMADKSDADVMIYGHTHRPYRRNIDGRVFINAGSVGKPKDGDPRACVAMLEIFEDRIDCRFLRVSYDLEITARAIIRSGLPQELAELLRLGR